MLELSWIVGLVVLGKLLVGRGTPQKHMLELGAQAPYYLIELLQKLKE